MTWPRLVAIAERWLPKPSILHPYPNLRLDANPLAEVFDFVRDAGDHFLSAYVPVVQRRLEEPFSEKERRWQLIRRGRYVEFNLLYDRGTMFGLKTFGRVESILMSLPLQVMWGYNEVPTPGSLEAELLEFLKPRDWVSEQA